MRTRVASRLHRAATETATDACHFAALAGQDLEDELLIESSEGVAEAAEKLQLALGEHLGNLASRFARMEEQQYTEGTCARHLKKQRDEQAAELTELLVSMRGSVTLAFGKEQGEAIFGSGKTPRRPWPVIHCARSAAGRLAEMPLPEQGPHLAGAVFDTGKMVARLEEAAAELEATLAEIAWYEKGAEMHLVEKREIGEKLELAQQDVARVLGGLYRLAGYTRLDQKVRSTHRKRRPRPRAGTAGELAATLTWQQEIALHEEPMPTDPLVHTGPEETAVGPSNGETGEWAASPMIQALPTHQEAPSTIPQLALTGREDSAAVLETMSTGQDSSTAVPDPAETGQDAPSVSLEPPETRPVGSSAGPKPAATRPKAVSASPASGETGEILGTAGEAVGGTTRSPGTRHQAIGETACSRGAGDPSKGEIARDPATGSPTPGDPAGSRATGEQAEDLAA